MRSTPSARRASAVGEALRLGAPRLAHHRARPDRLGWRRRRSRWWLAGHDHSLGLVDEHDNPGDHFGHEQERANSERGHQPAKLLAVQRRASAHVKCEIAVDQRQGERLAFARLEVGIDEPCWRERELPVASGPKYHENGGAQGHKAADRDPARGVDAVAKGLTAEERRGDRRGSDECPGSRAQLDYSLLLVLEATLCLLKGKSVGLGIWLERHDRSRMHRTPDV
jgi:hypothetical protein